MKDDLQQKWLDKSTLEELEGGILENCLGCEILVVGLKSDLLQVKFTFLSTISVVLFYIDYTK